MKGVTVEAVARHDRAGPRYTSYPTAIEFDESYGPEEHRAVLEEAGRRVHQPLSLYVHLPFCRARCSFCACHVTVTRRESLAERYLRAVERETSTLAAVLGDRRRLIQYHWGGGTPTFHSPAALVDLHRSLLRHFDLHPSAELSVEVDPRVTGPEHLHILRDLGFNRLSAGVQDLNEEVQALIGRYQTSRQTEELVAEARALDFPSINLDLVYGLPGQTTVTLATTLEAVLALRPERLAVYSFAYVPWMRPHQRRIDPTLLPRAEERFEFVAMLVETLTGAGYAHIGMDHFALCDDELAVAARHGRLTRNFMGYSTVPDTDVVAVGTSGISDVDGVYGQNHRRLASYLQLADEGRLTVERGHVPTFDDRIRRHVITRLMCTGLVRLSAVGEAFGVDALSYFADEIESMTRPAGLVEEGLAVVDGDLVEATELGRYFIRRLAMAFDAYLPRHSAGKPRFSRTI